MKRLSGIFGNLKDLIEEEAKKANVLISAQTRSTDSSGLASNATGTQFVIQDL
jgi:hypothetical protein